MGRLRTAPTSSAKVCGLQPEQSQQQPKPQMQEQPKHKAACRAARQQIQQ
jgi:hypothetical protein